MRYKFTRTMKYGDTGQDVVELQNRLKALGYFPQKQSSTGYYGDITAQSVYSYQICKVVNFEPLKGVLSYVGCETLSALNNSATIIDALIIKESGGDDFAEGDKGLPNHAYGCLQIRKPCVDDVNSHFGTSYISGDTYGNRILSIEIAGKYLSLWADPVKIGRLVTDQDRARIWNGGPDGWKSPATISYGNDVLIILNKLNN